MAWPPAPLPINYTDATPQQALHPSIHNATSQAVNDTVAQLGAVGGQVTDLATRAGVWRSAANQVMAAGVTTTIVWSVTAEDTGGWVVNGTDQAVPAGKGGLYALLLRVVVTPSPAAECIPSLVVATQPWVGVPAQIDTFSLALSPLPLSPGALIQARFYNGGALVNAAAQLTVYRVAP
jgi:hypothetical protein